MTTRVSALRLNWLAGLQELAFEGEVPHGNGHRTISVSVDPVSLVLIGRALDRAVQIKDEAERNNAIADAIEKLRKDGWKSYAAPRLHILPQE